MYASVLASMFNNMEEEETVVLSKAPQGPDSEEPQQEQKAGEERETEKEMEKETETEETKSRTTSLSSEAPESELFELRRELRELRARVAGMESTVEANDQFRSYFEADALYARRVVQHHKVEQTEAVRRACEREIAENIGDVDVVRYLRDVQEGKLWDDEFGDVEVYPKGQSPAFLATKGGHADTLAYVLGEAEAHGEMQRVANSRDETGKTAMFWAVRLSLEQGGPAVAQLLLDAGCEVDAQDTQRETALWSAQFVWGWRFLKKEGADMNHTNLDGKTLLVHRVLTPNAAKTALELGVSVNKADAKGNTAMHVAIDKYCRCGPGMKAKVLEIVATLIKHGARLDTQASTPLHVLARHEGEPADIERLMDTLLQNENMRVDMAKLVDANGNTPLHIAATESRSVFQFFVYDMSIRVLTKNHAGFTPLDLVNKRASGSTAASASGERTTSTAAKSFNSGATSILSRAKRSVKHVPGKVKRVFHRTKKQDSAGDEHLDTPMLDI